MRKEVEEELKDQIAKQQEWEALSPEQKKKQLFLNQKKLLETFRDRNAISQMQYEKSLGDLRLKMGFPEE